MNISEKLLLRTATRIHDQFLSIRATSSPLPLPTEIWNRCTELARQLHLAECRGWHRAAAILRDRYQTAFNRLVEQLRELQTQIHDPDQFIAPSLRQLSEELTVLSQEVEGVRIDFEDSVIAVTTDRIVLEGVDLGPFEIRLYWNRIGQRRCYDTVALTPNPSCGDEDVTHPHVRSDALCEGDGKGAIERALRDGRLCDFVSIVTRILHTYSPGSPYVSLEQWNGVACADCGSGIDAEEATRCSNCNDNLCLDCRTYCERCECDFCQSCVGSCNICDATLCRDCQTACVRCGKRCCSGCLSETELCEECQDEQQPIPDDIPCDEEEASTSPCAPAPTGTATHEVAPTITPLQPVRLG